jgi:hypothetical protein
MKNTALAITEADMQREKYIDLRRLSQTDAAEAHGVDPRTLRRWTAYGMPRNRDDTYDLAATVQWRCVNCNSKGEVFAPTDYRRHW